MALLAQTGESSHAFYQLYDLLAKIAKDKQQGINNNLSTRDILLLTLRVYSVIGDSIEIQEEHEKYLQKGFIQSMLASNPKGNARAVSIWIAKVFSQLRLVSQQRTVIPPPFRQLIDYDSVRKSPAIPFLTKLSEIALTAPSQGQESVFPTAKYSGESVIGGVLTGFSRLIRASPTHPSEFKRVMLMVIGGVSFQEISDLRQLYKPYGIDLVVVSTTITGRDHMMTNVFKSK
jgi:hypothetical protein